VRGDHVGVRSGRRGCAHPAKGPAAELRVTGILRFPDDLLPVAEARTLAAFTDALGIDSPPVVPLAAVLAVAAGALVVANLVAAVPGRAASRLRPATALRSE
jgi:ABC-type antimicrobial peptide transport system permease subunit